MSSSLSKSLSNALSPSLSSTRSSDSSTPTQTGIPTGTRTATPGHAPVGSSARSRRLRRGGVAVAAGAVCLVATAVPAFAHVTVSSPDAAPGGFGKVVFRVPTESERANTVKLTITLPRSTPFAFVSTKVHPGWRVQTRTRTLDKPLTADGFTLTKATSSVTWTAATGRGVAPGEFDEFELSVGPFPQGVQSVSMPAVQTYSDGTVVRWDQASRPGQAEPEHPAPTLDLGEGSSTESTSAADSDAATAAGQRQEPAADTTARWLGGVGLGLGAVAVGIAVANRRRRA